MSGCTSSQQSNSPDTIAAEPSTLPTGPWSAANITRALSNKTFTYTEGSKSGQVTYHSDFTFSYNEAGKGQGTGVWQPSENSLCEAYNPTAFLPKGTASRCQPFSTSNDVFAVGSKRLMPA